MSRHASTTIIATTVFALMISLASVNRTEAHRGWGWGIGAGIASALILGGIYRHHRHYYGGYYRPRYAYYGYRPYYGYRYYRPRYAYVDTDMGALAGVIITIAADEFSAVQNYRPIKKARTLTRLFR